MNRYSRIFYHIDAKDVKEKHLENLAVQKADEEYMKPLRDVGVNAVKREEELKKMNL